LIKVDAEHTLKLSQVKFLTTATKHIDGKTYQVGTSESNKVISNIISHYHKSRADFTVEKDEESIAAYENNTNTIHVSLNKEGKTLTKFTDDYRNLKNILFHEEKHRKDKESNLTTLGHIDVYLYQVNDKSFVETSPEFKQFIFKKIEFYINKINWDTNKSPLKYTVETAEIQKKVDELRIKYKVKGEE
jgi:hypothetical protein